MRLDELRNLRKLKPRNEDRVFRFAVLRALKHLPPLEVRTITAEAINDWRLVHGYGEDS